MNKKAVPVGDLQFGMYITELDRPWTETPFAFQGFWLQTDRQLAALRKFCKHVFIDAAKSQAKGPAPRRSAPEPDLTVPAFEIHGNADYARPSDLPREIEAATLVYSRTCEALEELLEPLERGATRLEGAEVAKLADQLADSVIRNPEALLLLSKVREIRTPAHARALQVSIYMMVFGRFLQRQPEEIELLGLLGLLQDVGMVRMPAALILKHGPLTEAEAQVMKRHVELSAHILGITTGLPPKFGNLALLHHERQDGTGYPRRLRGYQVGLPGSIAAICDAYETMLAPPPYGEGQAPGDAIKHLVKGRGSAFHGPLLEQFIRCMGAFPVGSTIELTSGDFGVVVGEHLMQRLTPKVLLLIDRAGKLVRSPRIVDLAAEPDIRIRRTLEQGQLAFDPRRLF